MKKLLPFLSFVFLIFSCSESDDPAVIEFLEDHEQVLNFSTEEAELFFSAIGLDEVNADVTYDFKVYEITYTTTYKDQEVVASAMVSVPVTEEPLPILSFQHGTIVDYASAPSQNLQSQLPLFGIASTGYIVVIPDFLGFGSSTNIFHPYYVEEAMGQSIADAIYATKELMTIIDGQFSSNVFLAGYSEGGYATMAAHKYMENNPRSDVNLIASGPAAGGYDVKGMQEYFFSLDTYGEPFYLAYVVLAYKEFYGWDDPLSLIFQEPYASQLPALFSGELSGGQINDQLTEVMADYLTPDILENFDTSPQYSRFRNALIENTILDWTPVAPMYMYHGTADVTVPFQNSVDSYEALQQRAGNVDHIEFIPIEGGTHRTGALPYVRDVYYRFKELK